MATTISSPTLIQATTPGFKWTKADLEAYRILVASQNVDTFFGKPLPQASVNKVILENEGYPSGGIADKLDRLFFCYLNVAMTITSGEESGIVDFTNHLLGLLDFDAANRLIRRRNEIPFVVCGEQVVAQADVSLVDEDDRILLVVQEDRNHLEKMDAESCLILEAIAAFQFNNIRLKELGLPPIRKKTIPGFTMCGTTPTFYKVPVTPTPC